MIGLLYMGGAALLVGFAVAAAVGRRGPLLVAVGVVLAVAFVAFAYFSAPTSAEESNCSDCGEYLGRWWEPWLVAWIVALNLAAWCLGVALGLLTRRTRSRRLEHA